MDYNYKAELTTFLSTYLLPILVGYGFSTETSNMLIGVLVAVIIIACNMLNERYISKHLSLENKEISDYLAPDDDNRVDNFYLPNDDEDTA